MVVDWPTHTLDEAGVELLDCLHKTPPDAGEGLPYVAIPQMKEGRILLDGVRRITREHFLEWTQKAHPEPHDVLLSRRCNPGVSAYVRPGLRFAVGQNLVLLRANGTKVYPPFLRWWVSGPDWWSEVGRYINAGAVFDSLRCGDIPKFSMPLPPFGEQRRIAAILGALDDKIELNRKMNRTLEEMAQALFKSWFIDFDGHEKFVDSNMGQIPHGWAEGSIETVGVRHRATVQPEDLVEGTPYVGLEHVPRRAVSLETWGVNEQVTSAKAQFQRGDILFGRLRPYFHKVVPAPMDGVCSTDILVVRPKADVWRWFVFGHLYSDAMVAHATASSSGTRMPRAKWADLVRFPFAVPPISRVAEFDACARPMFERIWSNIFESRTLTTLRDTLLPKLISGELRVPEAEALAAEVL